MTGNSRRMRAFVAGIAVALLLSSAVVPASAATDDHPSFTVKLHPDGSATVTVSYTFDLTTDNESQAFQQLSNNQSVRDRFARNFRARMQAVANDTEDATGRSMSVSNASVSFTTAGQTGVVKLSVTWEGLAAVDGDRLVLSEPFASEFTPDRRFRVVAPDGYELTSVTPSPDSQTSSEATWKRGTSLDGFEVVATSTAETTTTTTTMAGDTTGGTDTATSGGGPGFGVVAALGALLAVALLVRRR